MEDRQPKSNQTLPYRKGEVDFSNCRSWMSKPFSRMRPEVGGNSPDIILGGNVVAVWSHSHVFPLGQLLVTAQG